MPQKNAQKGAVHRPTQSAGQSADYSYVQSAEKVQTNLASIKGMNQGLIDSTTHSTLSYPTQPTYRASHQKHLQQQ